MDPYQTTELDTFAFAGNDGGLAEIEINKTTHRVTGRGARNRELVDTKVLLKVDSDDAVTLIGQLARELLGDRSIEVVGGTTTQAVTVDELPPMTREQAASLIGKLARELV